MLKAVSSSSLSIYWCNSSFNFFLSITNNLNKNTIFTPELQYCNTPYPIDRNSYIIMVIQHKQLNGKGMFYVGQNGAILAEMVYTMTTPTKMTIEHTEVDDSLGGKGVGKQLVFTAVEYARTHNLKIVPLCSFAKSVFDKEVEWHDVLA